MKQTGSSIFILLVFFVGGCVSFPQFGHEPAEESFVKTHVQKGTEHERSGDYPEALKHYKMALTVNAANPQAVEGRSRLEANLKNSAEESYRKGLEAQKQGRDGEAQREFLTALRLRPGYPEALEKIMSGKEKKETEVKRHVVHKIRPGESLSQIALAYYGDPLKYPVIARYNKLRDAGIIRVGEEILIPEPGVASPTAGGASLRTLADPEPLDLEAEVHTAEEDPVGVYREQGLELFEEKRYEEALAEFKKVLSVQPDDSVAREYSYRSSFEIAMDFFGSGAYLSARDRFKESLDYRRDCARCEVYIRKSEELYKETHYLKGMQHYGKEQLTEAIREWEMVRNVDRHYKRVEDYIEKARELLHKLEDLKMELKQGTTGTGES